MNILKKLWKKLKDAFSYLKIIYKFPLYMEQNKFILNEIRRLNELMRFNALEDMSIIKQDTVGQTYSSFDYQWRNFNYGIAMPDDQNFMRGIEEHICRITDTGKDWFEGKKILDLGCGAGRFTYGFLKMGANVCSTDQSEWAIKQTKKLCEEFSDKLTGKKINILEWKDKADYDLVFSFGVVHHTGNTYQAIINAANKVKDSGGRIFLMIYGFPQNFIDFKESNLYEELRLELRNLSFEEKKKVLIDRFGSYLAHGYFDAISPRINDLLTFKEIEELLLNSGFENIRRTIKNRNHHIMAEKL